jgi:hypothetical protein
VTGVVLDLHGPRSGGDSAPVHGACAARQRRRSLPDGDLFASARGRLSAKGRCDDSDRNEPRSRRRAHGVSFPRGASRPSPHLSIVNAPQVPERPRGGSEKW